MSHRNKPFKTAERRLTILCCHTHTNTHTMKISLYQIYKQTNATQFRDFLTIKKNTNLVSAPLYCQKHKTPSNINKNTKSPPNRVGLGLCKKPNTDFNFSPKNKNN